MDDDDGVADDDEDVGVWVSVVPPSKSSLTYRSMELRQLEYMVRPRDTSATCSKRDLASVTSSKRA